jgi:cell division protease FtsH
MENDIQITLAGRIAEELVFGDEYKNSGASSDYLHATSQAAGIVRHFGMGDAFGYYTTPKQNDGNYMFDVAKTDEAISVILKMNYERASKLMVDNKDYLIKITEELIDKSALTPEEFKKASKEFVDVMIVDPQETLEPEYKSKFDAFKHNKLK